MPNTKKFDVIIIGAGAAGLMAASVAGGRNRKVLLIESTNKIGEKIRISGGGRCNFTNINASSNNYLSQNPHFMKSALSRYTQHDFLKLVNQYKIAYHEKTLGQLFCDSSSSQIIDMLVNECKKYDVTFQLNSKVISITKNDLFSLKTQQNEYESESLIIATGGLSIPKIGASSFGYEVAKQFGINIIKTSPALVPLTVPEENLTLFKSLSGISIDAEVKLNKTSFRENILFTHRGVSGPAILQISSYLDIEKDKYIEVNLLPEIDFKGLLLNNSNNKASIKTILKEFLPNRFVDSYFENLRFVDLSKKEQISLINSIEQFKISISGTEGYSKAEVTKGGVNTKELSSKTMASNKIANLYFIGEVVDVTGWLGGYNFQWAWSSGYAAGSYA